MTPANGQQLTIQAPNFQTAEFRIRGTAPYVQSKFPEKAKRAIKDKHEAGSTAKKGGRKDARNFEEEYLQSMHVSDDGWYGIPASAFRAAMVSACRTVGFKMTLAKLSVFTEADGFDRDDGTPLVRITKGEPHQVEHQTRIQMTTNLAVRAMWNAGWEAVVRVRFDADQFTVTDIANLLLRVGLQVGLGEGRADSRQSTGMGWGHFELVEN